MGLATRCYRCGAEYPSRERTRCECGEPLWFSDRYADGGWELRDDEQGMWRYRDALPVDPPGGLATGVGATPVSRCPRLDESAGCRVFVKEEAQNPTGAYKDRGSAVALADAVERGIQTVGTVSYGNMAISTAAHAASFGRDCVVLVPADLPSRRLELIGQYDPTIVRVSGDYGALYDEVTDGRAGTAIEFYLSDAPTRVSGYKTCAYEIYHGPGAIEPDAIVVPTSSGGFASGLWRGLIDLERAGTIERLPRLYLVQTETSGPIARAYARGDTDVTALSPDQVGETIATSIGNPDPPSGTRALAAARDTGGSVVSVSDLAIREASAAFATRGGFCVEPASATPLAAASQLSAAGEIGADEDVLLLPTGTGFKEAEVSQTPTNAPEVDRQSLASRLDDIAGDG